MTPIFDTQALLDTRATTRIFPRGEYEVRITNVAPMRRREPKDDGTLSHGVRYYLEMVGPVLGDGSLGTDYAEEEVTAQRCYVHNKGSLRMTKRFLMAAFGYGRNDEDTFVSEVLSNGDFSVDVEDPDNMSCGSGWGDCVGNHVRVTLSEGVWEDNPSQEFGGWTPVSTKRRRKK